MIEKILFYSFMHESQRIEKVVTNQILDHIEKRKIDSLFFEALTSYKNISKKIPDHIPLFLAEHLLYHKSQIEITKELVSFYKAIKSGVEVDKEKQKKTMTQMKKLMIQRNYAIAQNVLVRSYDENLQNPGIICGGKHGKPLQDIFEKRGYKFEICQDYAKILESERKVTDYAIRNFSVPLLEE